MVVGVVVDNGSLMFGAKVLSISAPPGSAPQRPELPDYTLCLTVSAWAHSFVDLQ